MAECVEYLEKTKVLDYLIKRAEEAQADFDENGGESGIYVECLKDVIQDITSMDATDAVPVVRCKNCEYGKDAKVNIKGFCICPASHMEITDDDFCSYGEIQIADAVEAWNRSGDNGST